MRKEGRAREGKAETKSGPESKEGDKRTRRRKDRKREKERGREEQGVGVEKKNREKNRERARTWMLVHSLSFFSLEPGNIKRHLPSCFQTLRLLPSH